MLASPPPIACKHWLAVRVSAGSERITGGRHWFWQANRMGTSGEHILTMEPLGTAVRTAVSPDHARPSGPKLSVLFRRSYALSSKPCLDRRGSQPSSAPDITSQAPLHHSALPAMAIADCGSALPSYPLT